MRIFANLVENALRHAPKGSLVTIGLKDDDGHVKAFVDDAGPGLPKEFKPAEAFSLFSKGKQGGGKAGLGLYFCRITVERWGGSIGCESLLHRGARFWFRLPRAARTDSIPASSPVPAETTSFRPARLTILLVDDNPAVLELNQILLERDGHGVTVTGSGAESLRLLAKRPFDVIFLDEEMPGLSGVEVAKRIRAREAPAGKRQIIFALTGNTTEEDRARLLAAGFDACLGKPFRAEEFHEVAARFSLGTFAAPATSKHPASAAADSSLLARVGGDPKLLRSIVHTFVSDYPAKLRKIKQAIARKDATALAASAHAMKGAVAIFGAQDAVESAVDLQQMGRQGNLANAPASFLSLDEALARLNAKLREYAPSAKRNPSSSSRGKHRVRKSRQRARRGPRR